MYNQIPNFGNNPNGMRTKTQVFEATHSLEKKRKNIDFTPVT